MAKFAYKKIALGVLSAGLALQSGMVYAVDAPVVPAPSASGIDGIDSLPKNLPTQDAGSLLNQKEQELKNRQDQFSSQTTQPEVKLDASIDQSENKENSIKLKGVTLTGDKDVVTPVYEKALTDALTRVPVTLPEIYAVLGVLSNQLSQKGILVRFELPEQDVTEGILQVYVVVAKISLNDKGEPDIQVVRADNSKQRTSLAFIQKVARASLKKAMVRSKGRLLISDLDSMRKTVETVSNTSAQIALAPGEQAGSTRAVLVTSENRLLSGQAWTDYNGNESTGKLQAGVQVSLLNPLGYGDQATLSVSGSKGLKIGRTSFGFPVGYSGLRANLQYTYLDYELIDSLSKTLGISGTSKQASATLSYPWLVANDKNINLSATFSNKQLEDEYAKQFGVVKRHELNLGSVSIDGSLIDSFGGGGQTRYQVEHTLGHLNIKNAVVSNTEFDRIGYRTAGNFQKTNLQLNRLQQLNSAFQAAFNFNGQLAYKNLSSSEQFFLGGVSGVRAYPSSEGAGDTGATSSLELIYNLVKPYGRVQLKGFFDYGFIGLHYDNYNLNTGQFMSIDTATKRSQYGLSGAGLSLMLTDQKRFSVSTTWAHTIGENPGRTTQGKNADGGTDKQRFWLQGVVAF